MLQTQEITVAYDKYQVAENGSQVAAPADRYGEAKPENLEAEEWELVTIPNEWKPAPLFKVRSEQPPLTTAVCCIM